jgi:hypothetical protein
MREAPERIAFLRLRCAHLITPARASTQPRSQVEDCKLRTLGELLLIA